MKGDIDFGNIKTASGDFIHRFHSIIFFGVISIALGVALLIIVDTLTTTSGASNEQSLNTTPSSSFDQSTITILQQSQQPGQSNLTIPSGRINPFE